MPTPFRTLAAALLLASAPAGAVEPRVVASPSALRGDAGAVRLSVRSQAQLGGTLHLWFLRDGGDPSNDADLLKFERKQGVPLMGTNTIDSRPRVYAVRPGRYRLLAHGVQCDGLPPEGAVCKVTVSGVSWTQPTGRYAEPAPAFEVRPAAFTDAGEYVLEFPAGTDVGRSLGFRDSIDRLMTTSVRWRPVAAAVPRAFAALPTAPAATVPEAFRSNLRCEAKPEDAKGMMLYYPFDC